MEEYNSVKETARSVDYPRMSGVSGDSADTLTVGGRETVPSRVSRDSADRARELHHL